MVVPDSGGVEVWAVKNSQKRRSAWAVGEKSTGVATCARRTEGGEAAERSRGTRPVLMGRVL